MDDIHLSREILRAVDQGSVPRSVLQEITTEHLMSLCPHCRAEIESYDVERRAGPSILKRVVQIFSALVERWVSGASRELRRAQKDLDELLHLSAEERTRRIERARGRFRSSVLVRLLIDESRRCIPMRVAEAVHLAELARHIVTRIPQIPGSLDLYVSATVHLANAFRVGNDRRKANDLFILARRVMKEHGVTDPRIVARVDDLLGSLRTDQCRFPEAERLLERAAMLFGVAGAVEDAARVLIKLGNSYRLRGDLSNAIETTRSALGFLGPHADFNLHVAGHYNLALQLAQAERFEEAADLLEADKSLYRRVPEPWLQLRLVWLRGDIAAGRGELDVARQAYVETRDGFVALGNGYDAAIVSLDLALLYLRQGRTTDARQVAEELLPTFAAQDVHREALAALTLFQKAAR